MTPERKRQVKEAYHKLTGASWRLERDERRNTIINVNNEDLKYLLWALIEYCDNRGYDVRGDYDYRN